MAMEFADKIRRLPVYPAADGYGAKGDLALLASNETPFSPSPGVLAAATEALGRANRYPDPTNRRLREALSARFGVPVPRIAIGNGSCDILMCAGEALLEPDTELVYAWPSFSVYPHLAAAAGAREVRVELDADHRHQLGRMLEAISPATRLVIVCNPNNPTSTALPLADITAFLEQLPDHVAVILDEAYCEFNELDDPDASVPLLDRFPNLVLLRTFSKVYGLSGLRVGYALCGSESFRTAVDQVRQPFFCSVAAQAAAEAALAEPGELARRVAATLSARTELLDGLRGLGVVCAESQANFVWLDLGDGVEEPAVIRGLAEAGVIVRAGTPLGRKGALRVTVGTPRENRRFLDALAPLL